MNILEQVRSLLKLHGVDGSKIDRIDVALDMLYKVEVNEYKAKQGAPTQKVKEDRKPKKEAKAPEEEHLGF